MFISAGLWGLTDCWSLEWTSEELQLVFFTSMLASLCSLGSNTVFFISARQQRDIITLAGLKEKNTAEAAASALHMLSRACTWSLLANGDVPPTTGKRE